MSDADWIDCAKLGTVFLIVLCIAVLAWGARTQRKALRVKYRDLNAQRITPRFNVGSDVK